MEEDEIVLGDQVVDLTGTKRPKRIFIDLSEDSDVWEDHYQVKCCKCGHTQVPTRIWNDRGSISLYEFLAKKRFPLGKVALENVSSEYVPNESSCSSTVLDTASQAVPLVNAVEDYEYNHAWEFNDYEEFSGDEGSFYEE